MIRTLAAVAASSIAGVGISHALTPQSVTSETLLSIRGSTGPTNGTMVDLTKALDRVVDNVAVLSEHHGQKVQLRAVFSGGIDDNSNCTYRVEVAYATLGRYHQFPEDFTPVGPLMQGYGSQVYDTGWVTVKPPAAGADYMRAGVTGECETLLVGINGTVRVRFLG